MGYVGFREGTSSQTSVSKPMVSLARGSVACSTCSTNFMSSAISVVNPWKSYFKWPAFSHRIHGTHGIFTYMVTWMVDFYGKIWSM